jgi:gluconolactonase
MQLQDVEIVAEGLAFPEGPVAMADGSVILVEMTGGRLSRVSAEGQVSVVADVGGGPNGAAIGPDGAVYVCNNGGLTRERTTVPAIQRVDAATGEVDVLYTGCDGRSLIAPNDLVFDRTGHFWFTDFGGNAIYYASADGTFITCALYRVPAPNGIGLAPSGDVLYWAQTYTRQVHRRRVNRPGELVASPRYEVATFLRHERPDPWTLVVGLPGAQELDSLAVDAHGAVCVGTLLHSGVTVVDPDDGSYEKYTLPDRLADGAVTNICFGGPDLRTAYVTCSVTGRLLSCRWPRPGLQLMFQDLPGSG